MNDQPVNINPNTFNDIAPAGQTMPPTTSRPVIVGNRPEQTDQMVHWPSSQLQLPAQPPGGQANNLAVPDLPAAAQPSYDYTTAAPIPTPGTAITPQTAAPTNYVPQPQAYSPSPPAYQNQQAGNYAQPQTYWPQPQPAYNNPPQGNYVQPQVNENPAPDMSFINDQAVVGNDRSLLKTIFWFGILIFSVGLFIFTLIKWHSL